MQVYELITCVRRANENAGNLISVVQFLINIYIPMRYRKPNRKGGGGGGQKLAVNYALQLDT